MSEVSFSPLLFIAGEYKQLYQYTHSKHEKLKQLKTTTNNNNSWSMEFDTCKEDCKTKIVNLLIEFAPQRLFLIGLLVSALVSLSLALFLSLSLTKSNGSRLR